MTDRKMSGTELIAFAKTGFSDISDDECMIIENYALECGIKGSMWEKEFTRNNAGDGYDLFCLNEIREKRSMAYTAYAFVGTQGIAGKASYLRGYIGTQNDKANDALDVLMGLVNDMPKNPERIDNIKSYLRQAMLTSHPSFRNKAMELVDLGYRGYTDDPAKENLPKVDALTFDDIVKFYEENIKDKPYCISIMGNPKNIDLKRLEKFGKVVKLNERKLFNTKDALF